MGWLEDATGYFSRVINPQGTAQAEPTPIEPSPPPAAFQPTVQPLAIPSAPTRGISAGADYANIQIPTKYVPAPPTRSEGTTLYVPASKQAQREVLDVKSIIYDPVGGGVGGYQIPPSSEPGFIRKYGFITTSGGPGALQSGRFSLTPLTPIIFTQESAIKFAPSAKPELAKMVLTAPEKFSSVGAEKYGGYVMPLDAVRSASNVQMGRYPVAAGNLANLVSPTGVNLPKSEWADMPWRIEATKVPAFQTIGKEGMMGVPSSERLRSIGLEKMPVYGGQAVSRGSAFGAEVTMQPLKLPEGLRVIEGGTVEPGSYFEMPGGKRMHVLGAAGMAALPINIKGELSTGMPGAPEIQNLTGKPIPEKSAMGKFVDVFTMKSQWEMIPPVGVWRVLERADPYASIGVLVPPVGEFVKSEREKGTILGAVTSPFVERTYTTAGIIGASYVGGSIFTGVVSKVAPIVTPYIAAAPGGTMFLRSLPMASNVLFASVAGASVAVDVALAPKGREVYTAATDITMLGAGTYAFMKGASPGWSLRESMRPTTGTIKDTAAGGYRRVDELVYGLRQRAAGFENIGVRGGQTGRIYTGEPFYTETGTLSSGRLQLPGGAGEPTFGALSLKTTPAGAGKVTFDAGHPIFGELLGGRTATMEMIYRPITPQVLEIQRTATGVGQVERGYLFSKTTGKLEAIAVGESPHGISGKAKADALEPIIDTLPESSTEQFIYYHTHPDLKERTLIGKVVGNALKHVPSDLDLTEQSNLAKAGIPITTTGIITSDKIVNWRPTPLSKESITLFETDISPRGISVLRSAAWSESFMRFGTARGMEPTIYTREELLKPSTTGRKHGGKSMLPLTSEGGGLYSGIGSKYGLRLTELVEPSGKTTTFNAFGRPEPIPPSRQIRGISADPFKVLDVRPTEKVYRMEKYDLDVIARQDVAQQQYQKLPERYTNIGVKKSPYDIITKESGKPKFRQPSVTEFEIPSTGTFRAGEIKAFAKSHALAPSSDPFAVYGRSAGTKYYRIPGGKGASRLRAGIRGTLLGQFDLSTGEGGMPGQTAPIEDPFKNLPLKGRWKAREGPSTKLTGGLGRGGITGNLQSGMGEYGTTVRSGRSGQTLELRFGSGMASLGLDIQPMTLSQEAQLRRRLAMQDIDQETYTPYRIPAGTKRPTPVDTTYLWEAQKEKPETTSLQDYRNKQALRELTRAGGVSITKPKFAITEISSQRQAIENIAGLGLASVTGVVQGQKQSQLQSQIQKQRALQIQMPMQRAITEQAKVAKELTLVDVFPITRTTQRQKPELIQTPRTVLTPKTTTLFPPYTTTKPTTKTIPPFEPIQPKPPKPPIIPLWGGLPSGTGAGEGKRQSRYPYREVIPLRSNLFGAIEKAISAPKKTKTVYGEQPGSFTVRKTQYIIREVPPGKKLVVKEGKQTRSRSPEQTIYGSKKSGFRSTPTNIKVKKSRMRKI